MTDAVVYIEAFQIIHCPMSVACLWVYVGTLGASTVLSIQDQSKTHRVTPVRSLKKLVVINLLATKYLRNTRLFYWFIHNSRCWVSLSTKWRVPNQLGQRKGKVRKGARSSWRAMQLLKEDLSFRFRLCQISPLNIEDGLYCFLCFLLAWCSTFSIRYVLF